LDVSFIVSQTGLSDCSLFAHSLHKQGNHNLKSMVTYKIQMDTRRPKSDGTYAISIRITHNRQSTTFNTGVFINQGFWLADKSAISSNHQNSALLNKTITETYLKVQKAVIELESEQDFSFDNLKERLNDHRPKPSSLYLLKRSLNNW
jgi:hypothetical protein